MNHFVSILPLLFLLIPVQLTAQDVPVGTIRGRVIDDSTNAPILQANTYVSNTVLGSTTDSTGQFEIKRVPVGPHTLIVSFIGYQTVLAEITVNQSEGPQLDVRLKPKQLQTASVEISAKIPTDWKKNLSTFERWFLGTSENARYCKILNPEILDFTSGGDWIEFEAAPPQQPIKIENRALGYNVDYILTRFRYVQKHLETGGIARFESLIPHDSDEAMLWRKNRLRAYYGSLRHFLSSLVRGYYGKEGFEVAHVTEVLGHYRDNVSTGILVRPTDLPFKKILSFRDYLEITYTKANADESYNNYEWKVGPAIPFGRQPQTSWIALQVPDVTVDLDGNAYGPFVIQVTGYWTFGRIADLLPLDFIPEPAIDTLSVSTPTEKRINQSIGTTPSVAKSLEPKLALGRVFFEKQKWDDAIEQFDQVLEKDTSCFEAHYLAAIARRERGKEALFENLIGGKASDWYKSERLFDWILLRDSTYQDALLQLAILAQYRKEFQRSIELGREQVRLKPERVDVNIALFKLYRTYVAENQTAAEKWLRTQSPDYAPYFAAEILRRRKYYDQAAADFEKTLITHRDIPSQLAYLSLARIKYAMGDAGTAEQYFWRAVNECSTPSGFLFLFEDLKYIFSDADIQRYLSLSSSMQQREFIRKFWASKNPTPGSPLNIRLQQHYERLLVAEEKYEYAWLRTQYNNPDKFHRFQLPLSFSLNDQYNDQGLIYIRYGQPDEIIRPMDMTNFDRSIDPEESWVYHATEDEPQRIVNFAQTGISRNIFRFSPMPSSRDVVAQLSLLDKRYRHLDPAVSDEIINDEKKSVSEMLTHERYTYSKTIENVPIAHAIDAFRGTEGNDLVDVSFAVPVHRLEEQLESATDAIRSEVSVVFQNTKDQVASSSFDTITFKMTKDPNGARVGYYRFSVAPDTYTVTMQVHPIGSKVVTHWRTRKIIPDFGGDTLALSDVQLLLPSSDKAKLEIQGVKVGPNPFRFWSRSQPLYIYFHVYNLATDKAGGSSFTTKCTLAKVSSQGLLGSISNLFSSSKPVLQRESFDISTVNFYQKFLMLDVQGVEPGDYLLNVAVTDRKSTKTVYGTLAIHLTN